MPVPPPIPPNGFPAVSTDIDDENPFKVLYRAMYDCVPGDDEPNSLAFKEGEIITFIEDVDDQKLWFQGSIGDRTGYVPYNYVQLIEELG